MQFRAVLLCIFLLCSVGLCSVIHMRMPDDVVIDYTPKASVGKDEEHGLWNSFKKLYKKVYDEAEELFHKSAFLENMEFINKHNRFHDLGKRDFRLGLNEYSDMTHSKFVKTMNGFLRNYNESRAKSLVGSYLMGDAPAGQLPGSVDWRTKGYVTPVKNQGHCGSCWAFSTTGSLEGQHRRQTGHLVSLSEQQLVDCSASFGNHGCEGGLMDQAFDYIKSNGGVDTEESYPYDAEEGRCHYRKSDVGATDLGYHDIPSGDEQALARAVAAVGPVSVAIDASHMSFQMYRSGVYNEPECSPTQLDHGVLVVGYGTEDGSDYWLIKNSWGESWGEAGYVKMARNQQNMCGVATQASYPVVRLNPLIESL